MQKGSPFWLPGAHAGRRPFLLARGRIAANLRAWFAAREFVEVETAALQVSPGNEIHLHAFATELISPGDTRWPLYLRTSPEFAAKKLLAAGETRIVEFARVFRNRERGALHHPEFTLLEWYRANEPYETLMDDCAALMGEAARAAGAKQFSFRDKKIDPLCRTGAPDGGGSVRPPCRHRSAGDGRATARAIGRALPPRRPRPPSPPPRMTTGAISSAGFWPSASSRGSASVAPPYYMSTRCRWRRWRGRNRAATQVAERFELYACGVELANAFGELTDAAEQRARFETAMAEKQRIHGESYPLDEDFLAALAAMPQASGMALGFDRLVMLATGASRIEQVIWTPVAEP